MVIGASLLPSRRAHRGPSRSRAFALPREAQSMLYHLFRYLHLEHGFPRLGTYPSFRMAAAFFTAFAICLWIGPRCIRWLRGWNAKDSYDKVGKERRAVLEDSKEGTPTMGGIFTLLAIAVSGLLFCSLEEPLVWLGLITLLGAGAIGYWDDHVKLFHPTQHGISAKKKLGALGLLSIGVAIALSQLFWTGELAKLQVLVLPFLKDTTVGLTALFGLPFLALVFLVITGSANAVNLSDGMDGLAAGLLVTAGTALVAMNYIVGDAQLSSYLFVHHVPGAEEVAVLMAGLVGAAAGFLWFNAAPAQVFMGDVGSLSFGALLGFAAVASRMELTLVVVGGVFVMEALSVLIQVVSFRTRGKRVFLCSPLHHHFQMQKVPETKIVARFWIVSALLAVFSVALFKVR